MFRPRPGGKRSQTAPEPASRAQDGEPDWTDPAVLAQARVNRESPLSVAARRSLARQLVVNPQGRAAMQAWRDQQDRMRAQAGRPPVTDAEFAAAAAHYERTLWSR